MQLNMIFTKKRHIEFNLKLNRMCCDIEFIDLVDECHNNAITALCGKIVIGFFGFGFCCSVQKFGVCKTYRLIMGNGNVYRPSSLIPTGINADGGPGTRTDGGGDCVRTEAALIWQCVGIGSVVYGGG